MSHELEVIDGRAQFLGRKPAWHRLSALPDNEEMGRSFGWDDIKEYMPALSLPVNKVFLGDLLADQFDPDLDDYYTLTVPKEFYLTVREDGQVVGQVGRRYTVIQAEQMWEIGEALETAGGGEVSCVSAGSLRDGRQFFFTYDMGLLDVNGEEITNYFSIVGSHDGSLTNQGIRSSIAVVCANTLAAALSATTHRFGFRHTTNWESKVSEAYRVLELAHKGVQEMAETVDHLQNLRLTTREFDVLLDALFPLQDVAAKTENEHARAREAVRLLASDSAMTAGFRGSAWSTVQAVNSYEQWNAPIRKTDKKSDTTTRALRQFDAAVSGKMPLTEKALKLVMA